MTKITHRTRYDRKKVAIEFKEPTRTKQSFRDECDINNIMAKYRRTGVLPTLIKENPMWGDFSNPVDFQEAQNIVIKAVEQFQNLPAHVRERFNNDPQKFLEFTHKKENKEEMGRLGLLKEDASKPKGGASNEASTAAPVEPGSEPKTKEKPAKS